MKQEEATSQVLGRNLRAIRLKQGYSQVEVARVLDVSFQQIQKYEKGKNRLSAENLFRLKHFFGTSYADFFENLDDGKAEAGAYEAMCLRLKSLQDPVLKRKLYQIVSIFMS